ncbi:sugar phosphate isomerase/epimerase [Nocardioides sp.]|uniref:sugar phosphate isomerase/epimerase family protein n=1 Tax=Nocardioides sp. TaxID=35761 RepID=UPI00260F9682|nr:sugar phosphate isomerase/epimerase [Nocardioides sp.]MDI6911727.1 sugar phosphate isomerase/epimerase [Nocardioides sp.]
MSAWKLSCADYTFPAVDHRQALRIIADLGFDGVDLGFFAGRSHVRPENCLTDPAAAGERAASAVREAGLVVADVFAQISDDFHVGSVNDPADLTRAAALDALMRCLDFAASTDAQGMTVLPGVHHEGEEWEASFSRSVDALEVLVAAAENRGLRLSVEPHVESLVATPVRASALIAAVPGLTLTLDPAHFVFSGHTAAEVDGLLDSVRHVQLRGGAPGVLQASSSANVIDFGGLVAKLEQIGYDGWLATEYVWSPWHDCDRVDNLTETVLLRQSLLADSRGSGANSALGARQ